MIRYAVYFVPPAESALYRFGASVIGHDCYAGRDLPPPHAEGFSADEWRQLTAEPRQYGFHATLKAPFRLREPHSEQDLIASLAEFARDQAPPYPFPAALRLLDGFAAMVPDRNTTPNPLADACVRAFDQFRAPMSEAERARRLRAPLTARQIAHLDRWGYPYVFEDFRFHMTLTGRLPREHTDAVLHALDTLRCLGGVPSDIAIETIALLRQDNGGPFRVTATASLHTPKPQRK